MTQGERHKLSVLFFDLDGTLTDPKEGITGCVQYALDKLDEPVPEQDALTWCIGPPLRASFVSLVGDARADEGVRLYRERFATTGLFENHPYEGIHEVLATLQERYTLYIASSKPLVFVDRIVDKFSLRGYFARIFGSELDGTRADKTELLNYALAECNLEGQTSISMIGDREHDIIGGRNNNLATTGVLYGYGSEQELRAAGAHQLARTVQDLPNLF